MKSPLIHLHAVGIVLLALMPLSAHGQTVSWVLLEILITGRERDIVYDIRLLTHSICVSLHDFPATQQPAPVETPETTQAPIPALETQPSPAPVVLPPTDFDCFKATCEGVEVGHSYCPPMDCVDSDEYCYYFSCDGDGCCEEDCEVVNTCSTQTPTTSPPPPTESPTTSAVTTPPTESPTVNPVAPPPTESPTASPVAPPPTESPTASPVAPPPTSSLTDPALVSLFIFGTHLL